MYTVYYGGKEARYPGLCGFENCHHTIFKEAVTYANSWVGGYFPIPKNWDGLPYSENGFPTIEIRNTNIALTDQDVTDLYSLNGIYAFPFEKLCSRCGEKWLTHIDIKCSVYPYTTYMPIVDSPSNGCDGCGASCDGCKGTSDKKAEPIKEEMPEWKRWRNDKPGECPCGMKREDCWIHRI